MAEKSVLHHWRWSLMGKHVCVMDGNEAEVQMDGLGFILWVFDFFFYYGENLCKVKEVLFVSGGVGMI